MLYDIKESYLTKETLWHRIKRRLLAKPVLTLYKGGRWILTYHWKDGTIEIVRQGLWKPGGIVKVPSGTKVTTEV